MFNEFLNQAMSCPKCGGEKKLEINGDDKKKENACTECGGQGMIVDNRVGDVLKKYLQILPKATRLTLIQPMLGEIYFIYDSKLKQAYEAGKKDGASETVRTPDSGN